MSLGGGSSGQSGSNYNYQGTGFPYGFAAGASDLGYPISPVYLTAPQTLPSTSSLFGGGPVGGNQSFNPLPPADVLLGPSRATNDKGQKLYTQADAQAGYQSDPQKTMDLQRLFKTSGLDANGFTLEQFNAAVNRADWASGRSKGDFTNVATVLAQKQALEEQARRFQDYANQGKQPGAGGGQPYQGGQGGAGTNPFAGIIGTNLEQQYGAGYQGTPTTPPQVTAPDFGALMSNAPWASTPTLGAAPQAMGYDATGYAATGYGVTPPPSIHAQQVTGAQMNIAPEGFEKFQKDLYAGQFDPVRRELVRQETLDDTQLKARLAASGLSSSPAGIDLLTKQDEEYGRRLVSASQDAANQARVQRFGYEFTQLQQNASFDQQARLQSAAMDLTAQTETAKNILTAGIATANNLTSASQATAANRTQASIASAANRTAASQTNAQVGGQMAIAQGQMAVQTQLGNQDLYGKLALGGLQASIQAQTANQNAYLDALRIDKTDAMNYRNSFLNLLQIGEADLARMDNFQLQSTSLVYNNFQQQLATLQNAGKYSVTKQEVNPTGSNLGFGGIGNFAGSLIGSIPFLGGGGSAAAAGAQQGLQQNAILAAMLA